MTDAIKRFFAKKGVTVTNETAQPEPIKIDIPKLSGVLSYDVNNYNADVELMQKRLNELGVTDALGHKLDEDGLFGDNTLAAVNKYKEQMGLWNFGEYEGKVGETTWGFLFGSEVGVNTSYINTNVTANIEEQNKEITLTLTKHIEEYTDFTINGVSVKIPYYMTPSGTKLYGGKATPEKNKGNFAK